MDIYQLVQCVVDLVDAGQCGQVGVQLKICKRIKHQSSANILHMYLIQPNS